MELLEDFAGRNAMALVIAEVDGLSGLGYFTQDDLNSNIWSVVCILYQIAPPIVPLPTNASSPFSTSDSASSLEEASNRVEHSGSVEIQQISKSHMCVYFTVSYIGDSAV